MNNLRLNYRYRDAHNYKEFGSLVFANPTGMSVEAATALLRGKLISGNPFSCKKMEIGFHFKQIPPAPFVRGSRFRKP